MKDNVATYTHKGCTINVSPDEDPINPRAEFDHLGTMFCLHRKYNLGDKLDGWQNRPSPDEYLLDLARQSVSGSYPEALLKANCKKILARNYRILDLYLYDHSGITMSCAPFSCPWDSGRVGIIHLSLKDAIKNWTCGDQKPTDWDSLVSAGPGKQQTLEQAARKALEHEVEEYDNYLTGSIYGYEVVDPNRDHIDACGGFFGYEATKEDSWMIDEARAAIDRWAEEQDTEATERAYWEARDTITT